MSLKPPYNSLSIDGEFSIINSKFDLENIEFGNKQNINEIKRISYELDIESYYIINYIIQKLNIILGSEQKDLDISISNAISLVLKNIKNSTNIGDRLLFEEVKTLRLQNKLAKSNDKAKLFEHKCQIDPLTGLGNRRFVTKELNKIIALKERHGRISSVLMIDIDFFKKINDEYSHDIGDKTLIEIAKLLNKCIRETDSVGRMGGEEFVIILPRTYIKNAEKIANQIREKVQNELGFLIKEINKEITISIGVSQTDEINDSPELINDRADKGLYMSKENGRNQVSLYISPELEFDLVSDISCNTGKVTKTA